MKRKVISLLVLIVMFASQFSVVLAEEIEIPSTGGTEITLSDYLKCHGVDENEDGVLSDVEWAKVKRLNLKSEVVDVVGIEKAINLKELYISDIDISIVDFSKLNKLEILHISCWYHENNINFSEIENATNLKEIYIYGYLNNSISNIDFSKLQKLESLEIQNIDNEICVDLSKISNATNLKRLSVNNNLCISNLDFSKLGKLEELDYSVYEESDISNISLASNLKRLYISNCKKINNIDFSKLSKLEYMYISASSGGVEELTLPAIDSLEELGISNFVNSNYLKRINLSNLNNLKGLYISSDTTRTLTLPKFKNLESLNIDSAYWENGELKITDYEIDLENCPDIYGNIMISDTDKLKLNNNIVIYKSTDSTYDYRLDCEIDDISICKDYFGCELAEFNNVICEENNILEIEKSETGYLIKTKNIGTQKVYYYDVLGRIHDVNVTVYETPNNNFDKELENSGITSEFVDSNRILKSNGELWEINSATTAEKIDSNVKDYEFGQSYSWSGYDVITIQNKLKFDNTLVIDISGGWGENEITYTNTISDVKEIGKNLYLKENGDLIEILYNYITDEVNLKKVKENVKRLIGNCIVLADGTTWCQDKYENKEEGIYGKINEFYKVADFEIKDAGWYSYEGKEYWGIVDLNNNLYVFDSYYGWIMMQFDDEGYSKEMTLLKENFKDYYLNPNTWDSYTFEDENVFDFYKIDYRDVILSNVTRRDYYYNMGTAADILIRTDGSIWTYSDIHGLTKITESTVIEDEDDENKTFLSENSKVTEKEIGEKTIISGVSKDLTVQEFNNQNNFNDRYQARVFDKSNKEINGESLLGTGSKVRLYENNKLVKEYVVVIYGDTTGDGKITAVDALALIKHINNKILFTDEVFSEAGRVRPNSTTTLTAVDALAIIKGVNGKFTINQNK